MEYKRFEDTFAVRLDRGDEILGCLTRLCEQEGILLASVEGIGASRHAVIGLYDVDEHAFHGTELNGPMEITSLLGNVTRKDGKVYLHLHATLCAPDKHAFGGHLNECVIGATAELFVRVLPGEVGRRFDEDLGLNLFRF